MIDVRKFLISPTGELPRRWSFQPCAGSSERVPYRRAAGLAGTGLRLLPEPPSAESRKSSRAPGQPDPRAAARAGDVFIRPPPEAPRPCRSGAGRHHADLMEGVVIGNRSGPPERSPSPLRDRYHPITAGDHRRHRPTVHSALPSSRIEDPSRISRNSCQASTGMQSPITRSSFVRHPTEQHVRRVAPRGSNPQPADEKSQRGPAGR